jgi:hypothetical protein
MSRTLLAGGRRGEAALPELRGRHPDRKKRGAPESEAASLGIALEQAAWGQ